MMPFAIAAIQMPVHHGSNIEAMRQRLEMTMHLYPWVQMVVFSELCVFGPLLQYAQGLPGTAEAALQDFAYQHGIWLISGSMYERHDPGIFNTTSIINPEGDVIGRYRKMFPAKPLEQGVQAGTEFFVWDVEGAGRFGISNSYDMWFPETSRQLAALGAEAILRPGLCMAIDRDVDLAVSQATAALMQVCVVDVNGLEAGGNGQSAIFDPSGRVLYRADSSEQIIPVELDFEAVRRVRARGARGQGQVLKSFRDRPVDFPVYGGDFDQSYLDSLGPLETPKRGEAVIPSLLTVQPVRKTSLQ